MKTITQVRIPGPVATLAGPRSAVWPGDSVRVLARIGSRRICEIGYGPENRTTMLALVPKKWLRTTGDERNYRRVA